MEHTNLGKGTRNTSAEEDPWNIPTWEVTRNTLAEEDSWNIPTWEVTRNTLAEEDPRITRHGKAQERLHLRKIHGTYQLGKIQEILQMRKM